MLKFVNPDTLGKPLSRYSHVVTAPESCRWVHISGQVGISRDGDIAQGFDAQARLTWANVLHAIRAAGMGLDDIVKVNAYLTRRADIAAYRSIRDEALQGRAPASTAFIVSGLVDPSLLIEIDVVAAQPVAAPRAAARVKAKGKAKAKTKSKAKAKMKAKAKARPKAKAKARPKGKARRR